MLQFNVTNTANIGKDIYIWHRVGKTLSLFKDVAFRPYFYQESSTGIYKTIDGKKVNKIICVRPSDIKNRRDENSYEADINYTKLYTLDRISAFGKADLHYSFIDIEVMCKELPNWQNPIQPISCISCSDNYTGEIKTFYLKDYDSIQSTYDKQLEDVEKQLLNDFVKWIKEKQFDLTLGWNYVEFDWRYLRARYNLLFGCELAEMLSPIAQSKYLGNSNKEIEPNLIPAGLSVMDFMEMFKKIYKTESSYALDTIAQIHLKEEKFKKVDFSRLSEEIKEKNINDVRRMLDLDKKFKIIEYYDELRRMSMCDWSDTVWNSKILDMVLLKEAKQKGIILPSKRYGQDLDNPFIAEETFEGAYRRCDILDKDDNIIKKYTGLHKNIYKLDLSGAYPQMIIDFCLDIANIKQNEGIIINQTKFYQNSGALLPAIAQKFLNKKDTMKQQLKQLNPESAEYKDLQIKYDAVKAVVNSLFGICGLKIFRLFDPRVASSITYLVRDLLHYVENKLQELGMDVIYLDTDSFFIQAKDNPLEICNQLVKQWAIEKYKKYNAHIKFDYEGIFEKIFILALCRYKGYLQTKNGIKEEIKGIEQKRKDSSVFIKEFQDTLLEKIMNEESQEAIIAFIKSQIEAIKQRPLIEIGFPCKLSKQAENYKSIPIHIRGLAYTKELINFDKRIGDSFYWLPIEAFGTSMRKSSRIKRSEDNSVSELQHSEKMVKKDVLCFDEEQFEHVKNVDWTKLIERSIYGKCENIFEALDWEISLIKEVKPKLRTKKKQEQV